MTGSGTNSKWNDRNELECLLAFKQLEEEGFPRNRHTELAKNIARQSGLKVTSVIAKIGNYKSVAGITRHSNASRRTIYMYEKYGHFTCSQIRELIASEKYG